MHRLPDYADKQQYPSTQVGSGASEWVGDYREIYTAEERSEIGRLRGYASGDQRRKLNYTLTAPWWCQHYHQGWSYALIAERYDQSRQRVRYHLSGGKEYAWREANDKLVKEGECVPGCPVLAERVNEIWSAKTRLGETKRREYRETKRREYREHREVMQGEYQESMQTPKGAISSFVKDYVGSISVLDLVGDYEHPPVKDGRKLTPYGRLTRRWSLTQKRTGYKRNIEGIGGATAWRRENEDSQSCTLFLRAPYVVEKFGDVVRCSDLYDLYQTVERVREYTRDVPRFRGRLLRPITVPLHLAYLEEPSIHAAIAVRVEAYHRAVKSEAARARRLEAVRA